MASHLPDVLPSRDMVLCPRVVLTPDGPKRDWAVAVEGGSFTAVGPRAEVTPLGPGQPVELPHVAIVPGFVDCHQHLTQVFAKAITGGEPAQMWKRIWMPLDEAMDPDDVYVAARWTCLEALRGGFTTIVTAGEVDPAKSEAAVKAVDDIGIRCVFAYGLSDRRPSQTSVGSESNADTQDCIQRAETILAASPRSPLLSISLSCIALESASAELIKAIARICVDSGVLFQLHSNEHTAEITYALESFGVRPIQFLADLGALGSRSLLAHTTLVTPAEVRMLADTGTAVSYNPVASYWKGNAVAPALAFADRGVRFGLGTDATRSDGFRLLEAAEAAQRLTVGLAVDDFSAGAAGVWVRAASAGGADAAGLRSVTGSIAPGYRADFLLLDMSSPECRPSWDFLWEFVRYYDRSHLVAVYVDGELRVAHGNPVGVDAGEFVAAAEPIARRVIESARLRIVHGPARVSGKATW